MWAADAPEEDDQWRFTEDGDGFSRSVSIWRPHGEVHEVFEAD